MLCNDLDEGFLCKKTKSLRLTSQAILFAADQFSHVYIVDLMIATSSCPFFVVGGGGGATNALFVTTPDLVHPLSYVLAYKIATHKNL